MHADLNIFRTAGAQAAHAARRQAVIAANIANADTPGYKARDIGTFRDHLAGTSLGTSLGTAMRSSRAGHLHGAVRSGAARVPQASSTAEDPNRNTVSVELEMMKSVEAKREHDRAVAIYRSSLNILRTSLGRG
ncbi:FlgB family protein [Pukyongiella litopenaei]|uniref:FlgB family protein n=1 Tax=Pukyongiella litopenaei TaxID=2605946 RepID=A0A2S0MS65_9RHOB|nr:FlgB family protein [Pukyongiella litopenaei]AVO38543.1 FlgB family protein [Pukyongiella litopenaei]